MPSRVTETHPQRIQLEAVRADLAVRVTQSVKAGTAFDAGQCWERLRPQDTFANELERRQRV